MYCCLDLEEYHKDLKIIYKGKRFWYVETNNVGSVLIKYCPWCGAKL
jgi:hypothetical protein